MNPSRKILVTGASGFLGSHLLSHLAASSQYELWGTAYGDDTLFQGINDIKTRICDLTKKADVVKLLAESRPDTIIHLAAIIPTKAPKTGDQFSFYDVNVRGTHNLLQAATEFGVKKLIFSSSINVYGRARYLPVDEHHPREPDTVYGLTKLLGELLCEQYTLERGISTVVLRFPGIFGAGRFEGFIFEWLRQAISREKVVIHSNGSDIVNTISVHSAVSIIEKFIGVSTSPYEVFNVAGEKINSLEATKMIIELAEAHSLLEVKNNQAPIRMYLDDTKIRQHLNLPAGSFQDELKELITYLKSSIAITKTGESIQK